MNYNTCILFFVLIFSSCDYNEKNEPTNTVDTPFNKKKNNTPLDKEKVKLVEDFVPEAFTWVGSYFNIKAPPKPQIFFDHEETGRMDMGLPYGQVFFHQASQKWAIYINPITEMSQLKPLIIHELTHLYQMDIEKNLGLSKTDHQYILGDNNLARNIIREGQAEYLANLWAKENNLTYPLKEIEASLKKHDATLAAYSPLVNPFLNTFWYSFGYQFLNKISQNLTKTQIKIEHENIFRNSHFNTTEMLNQFLNINTNEFAKADKLNDLMQAISPSKMKNQFSSLGAMTLVFYYASLGETFNFALNNIKKIDNLSGLMHAQKNDSILLLRSNKSDEIINPFITKLTQVKKGKETGIDYFTLKYHDYQLTILVKGSDIAIIQNQRPVTDAERSRWLGLIFP
jgi:hypothetical protein